MLALPLPPPRQQRRIQTEHRRCFAKRHGISGFTRFEDMLAAVDAVSFSLPPNVQAELAVKAADAGKSEGGTRAQP